MGSRRFPGQPYSDPLEDAKTCVAFSKAGIWYERENFSKLVKQITPERTPKANAMSEQLCKLAEAGPSRSFRREIAIHNEITRIISCGVRELKGLDTIPLVFASHQDLNFKNTERPATATDVLQIVVTAFPRPDGSTPIEKIMDFREDARAKGQIHALRRWMKNIASAKMSVEDATDELNWLLNEYENHMRLQRMKITHGTFETLITTGAEALEAVAKLNFTTLAKIPFALQKRKIDLLEAERSAPGREIAYLAAARTVFGK